MASWQRRVKGDGLFFQNAQGRRADDKVTFITALRCCHRGPITFLIFDLKGRRIQPDVQAFRQLPQYLVEALWEDSIFTRKYLVFVKIVGGEVRKRTARVELRVSAGHPIQNRVFESLFGHAPDGLIQWLVLIEALVDALKEAVELVKFLADCGAGYRLSCSGIDPVAFILCDKGLRLCLAGELADRIAFGAVDPASAKVKRGSQRAVGLYASSDPIGRFQDHNAIAETNEFLRSCQAGNSRADDDDIHISQLRRGGCADQCLLGQQGTGAQFERLAPCDLGHFFPSSLCSN